MWCPGCGTLSSRVHSRYHRKVRDIPWAGWPVELVVHARKFFWDEPECPRRIFTEQFPEVLASYARQTERVKAVLLELVHASNGEMAGKVAKLLGFITSPDTLIRLQRGESFALPSPRALGVDEFALRPGRTYATLLVDLERHRPVDLFEGLSAEPFTRWLQQHPQIEVLARDRAWAYALAGRIALPQALQVSDRFHLVYNVRKAFKELFHSRRWQVPDHVRQDAVAVKERRATPAKQARWEAVQQRKGTGASISAIARDLNLNRQTVSKYLAADQPPMHGVRPPGPSKVRPYLSYLRRRWIEGCLSARKLYHEVV
ncbi:MAG: ISL3 family transposase, partial [Dehalococcoidia bacterium]